MDETIISKIGAYLCYVTDAVFILIAWYIGHLVNGIPIEIFAGIGGLFAATSVLIKRLIIHYFKVLPEDMDIFKDLMEKLKDLENS